MSNSKVLTTVIKLMGKVDPSVSKAMAEAQRTAGNTSSKIKKGFAIAAAAVGTAAVAATVKSVKAYAAYQETLNKVSTIADTQKVSLNSLSKSVIKLSNKTGVAAGSINEAVYQAISAGTDTKDAVDMVSHSIKLAKGGFTDTTTAVDTLTTVMNAYGLKANQVGKISDMLITTQNLGKTTVNQLASSIGNVIPIASAYGVKMSNLSSALAILTQKGISTDSAVTYTKAMLTELAKSGSTVSKVLKQKTGKTFTELSKSGKSIGDVMKILGDSVGNDATKFSNLWSNTRAGIGALSLMQAGAGKYNQVLGKMQKSTGATEKAYEKMEEGLRPRIAKLKNWVKNASITAGKAIAPVLDQVLAKLNKINVDKVMSRISSGLGWLVSNGGTIISISGGIAAAMAGWKAGMIIASVAGAVRKAQAAEKGLTTAQALLNVAMNANPVGAVLAGITALVTGFILLYKHCEKFRKAVNKLWSALKKLRKTVLSGAKRIASGGLEKSSSSKTAVKVAKHATGGTFTIPHIAVIGDAPETIVPHGNTPRNRALLAEAAAGVSEKQTVKKTMRPIQFTYAPVISNGTSDDVKRAAEDGYERFKKWFRQLQQEEEAVSFG